VLLPKENKLIIRGGVILTLLFLVAAGLLPHFDSQPDKTVFGWMLSIALLIVGGNFWVFPLESRDWEPINRWQRAAHRAGGILCKIIGSLFIGAAGAGIAFETLAQHSVIAEMVAVILLVVGTILTFVVLLLLWGLVVIWLHRLRP
jgi:hypothetical protein